MYVPTNDESTETENGAGSAMVMTSNQLSKYAISLWSELSPDERRTMGRQDSLDDLIPEARELLSLLDAVERSQKVSVVSDYAVRKCSMMNELHLG